LQPVLTIERFAALRARIEELSDLEQALRDARLSPAEWRTLERHWCQELAREASSGAGDLGARYLASFFGSRASDPTATQADAVEPKRELLVPSFLIPRSAPTASSASVEASPPSTTPAVSRMTAWAPPVQASKPATPFEVLERGAQGVTLVQYAELCALLEADPGATERVLGDRALTPEMWRSVGIHYAQKLTQEPRWATEFQRLVARARASVQERQQHSGDPKLGMTRPIQSPSAASTNATIAPTPRPILPDLSVDQYAWIVASLRKATEAELPATLDRLRLTPAARAALETRWRERMSAEPGLADRFAEALRRHLPATVPAIRDEKPRSSPRPSHDGLTRAPEPGHKLAKPHP
jgi:hypothetical protein